MQTPKHIKMKLIQKYKKTWLLKKMCSQVIVYINCIFNIFNIFHLYPDQNNAHYFTDPLRYWLGLWYNILVISLKKVGLFILLF